MSGWLSTINATITLSSVAMISFIGCALLVYRYVIEELMPGIPGAVIQTVFVLLLLGVWIWSLFAANAGSRTGLIVALICTILPALFTLYDLIFYSPIRYGWPLVQISVWLTLLACAVAIASIISQLVSQGKIS